MEISRAVLNVSQAIPPNWSASWLVGLPLIVTLVFHVLGLGLIHRRALRTSSRMKSLRHPTYQFVLVVGGSTLLATILHGIEADLGPLLTGFSMFSPTSSSRCSIRSTQ